MAASSPNVFQRPPRGPALTYAVLLTVALVVLVPDVQRTETRCTTCGHGQAETVWGVTLLGPELSRGREPVLGKFSPCDRHAFVQVRRKGGGGLVGIVRWALGI
jgi:hypothetical protein